MNIIEIKDYISILYVEKHNPTYTGIVINGSPSIVSFNGGEYHNAYGPSEITETFNFYALDGVRIGSKNNDRNIKLILKTLRNHPNYKRISKQ